MVTDGVKHTTIVITVVRVGYCSHLVGGLVDVNTTCPEQLILYENRPLQFHPVLRTDCSESEQTLSG